MKAAAILIALVLATPSFAQEHHHPPQDVEMHNRFYKTWDRPDNPGVSCCSDRDCYPTEAKFENGSWFAKQRETGEWIRIPPEKIEHNRDAPDARAHVCMSSYGYVFCFIAGSGS